MVFVYKDREYQVEVMKKNNKNTYLRVRDGKIYISTNYFTGNRTINKLLKDNYKTITKMIDRDEIRLKNKELFLMFGNYYDIIYGDFEKDIMIEENCIRVRDEKVLCKWFDQLLHTTYYNRLMYWYDRFEEDIPIPKLKIRKMKTRWGVCNTKSHNVTLNFELFRYNIECLDYVIIHELAHFVVANHSREFWVIVERYCPNYKDIRKILRS